MGCKARTPTELLSAHTYNFQLEFLLSVSMQRVANNIQPPVTNRSPQIHWIKVLYDERLPYWRTSSRGDGLAQVSWSMPPPPSWACPCFSHWNTNPKSKSHEPSWISLGRGIMYNEDSWQGYITPWKLWFPCNWFLKITHCLRAVKKLI